MITDKKLAFIMESNRIEGINRPPTDVEISVHDTFWALDRIGICDLEEFVIAILGPTVDSPLLRMHKGMDVRVGSYIPLRGGPDVAIGLAAILSFMNIQDPYRVHVAYETLHPFMDGNGRSGRALWAWHMMKTGRDPFSLPFLHRWYYESLSHSR